MKKIIMGSSLAVAAVIFGMTAAVAFPGRREEIKVVEKQTALSGGMEFAATEEGEHISLLTAELSAEEFEAHGVAAVAEKAEVITATVHPVNEATNTALVWTAAWEDPNSEWARNREVSTYLTLSYAESAASSKSCTVSCLKAFGEPIVITVAAKEKPDVKATIRAGYVQKVTDFSLSFGDIQCGWGAYAHVTPDLGDAGAPVGGLPNLTLTTSEAYTEALDYEVTYKLTPARDDGILASAELGYYGTEYVGFCRFRSSEEKPQKLQTIEHDVKSEGLYFDLEFLHEKLGLEEWYDANAGYAWYQQNGIEMMRKVIYGAYHSLEAGELLPGYTNFKKYNDLFKLTVELKAGEAVLLTKETTFTAANVIWTARIDEVEPDRSEVLF